MRRKFLPAFSLITLMLILFVSGLVFGDVHYVPDDFANIKAAFAGAADGDTVILRDGKYAGADNKGLYFQKAITLRSENGPADCIIDCGGDAGGFYFFGHPGPQVLEGLTIMNGATSWGGAIYCDAGSRPEIRNCAIIGSSAELGGGICCNNSSPTIANCRITDNLAYFHGGAIYCFESSPIIADSIISANSSYVGGGGILSYSSYPTITNCAVSRNVAGDYGGALSFSHSFPVVASCTISDNSTFESGGGIDCYDSSATVVDSILWGNSASKGPAAALWLASSLDISYSDIEGGMTSAYVEPGSTLIWNTGNIDAAPQFLAGPLGDYYLSQTSAGQSINSPCVDAGSGTAADLGLDSYTTRTDHIGDSGAVDMGHHYGLMTEINLVYPLDEAAFSSPPRFEWFADGQTASGFAIDVALSQSGPIYSTYENLHQIIYQTNWTMPLSIWNKIPPGSKVYWRVRGADLSRKPLTIIVSEEIRTFYKP